MLFRPAALSLFLLLVIPPVQALNILLTNDDGYAHPWVRVVLTTLTDAGHQVTLVAPAENQSGKAAALTLSEAPVKNPEPGIYAVQGTPATAVRVGVKRITDERPDLVVSGINDGANIGVLSSFSGTVGATVAALHLAGEPIPGIAISSQPLDPKADPGSEINLAHATRVAEFLVRVISRLEAGREERGGLLPHRIALNINYPNVSPDQIEGVGVYRHGSASSAFAATRSTVKGDSESPADWDTTALGRGYITVVPIDGDYLAPGWQKVLPGGFTDSLLPASEAESK